MAIVPIVKSLYPKVPALAGVPTLLRSGAQIFDQLTLGVFNASGALNSLIGAAPVKWSVLDSGGKKIAGYESILSVQFSGTSDVADYPVERGSFASYNAVDRPSMITVVMALGSTENARNDFQSDLRNAKIQLTLFTILTEDQAYRGYKLIDISWSREATNGAHRIVARCEFREIREQEAQTFNQPAQPQGADQINVGQVQPIPDVTIDTSGVV